MPLDPSIPLGVRPLRIGEIAAQAIQFKRQREQSARQERALKIQEEQSRAKVAETNRKTSLRDFSTFAESTLENLYENKDNEGVERAILDEMVRVGKDSPQAPVLANILNQQRQNPDQALQSVAQVVKQARSEKLIPQLGKGEQINVLIPGKEGIQPGVENEQGQIVDPKTRELIPGAIKAPSRQETGGPGSLTKSQAGKVEVESIAAEQSTIKTIKGMENVIGLVTSDDFVGGVTGDATAFVNSGIAQLRQATGTDSVITGGKLDEAKLEVSSENMGRFRRAAISNDRVEAAILDLAYTLARQRDPNGKLSDADVRLSEKTIRAGADKASITALLRDGQKKALRDHNSDTEVLNRRLGKKFPLLKMEDVLGKSLEPRKGSNTEISNRLLEELNQSLNQNANR